MERQVRLSKVSASTVIRPRDIKGIWVSYKSVTSPEKKEKLLFGDYVLDVDALSLRRDGALIQLPPKVFDTLVVLVQHRGEVVSKDQLMKQVWPDAFVEENNLAQNVFLLRRKLGPTAEGGEYIQTVSKRGYRLSVPVQEGSLDAGTAKPSDPGTTTNEVATISATQRASRWIFVVAIAAFGVFGYLLWWWNAASSRLTVSGFVQLTNQMQVKQGSEEHPWLATDGPHIYFTGGNELSQSLFQMASSGGDLTKIPLSFSNPEILDFSAARSELLVLESSPLTIAGPLWTVPIPRGIPRRVGSLEVTDACWSPDGLSIAFTSGKQLYRSDVKGGAVEKLANLPGNASRPRWSPDGGSLRLTVVNIAGTHNSSIWEVGANGRALRRLLTGWSKQASECCGNWTSDGRHYLFQATRENRTQIWSLDRTPGFSLISKDFEPTQITTGEINFAAPVPSPDGNKIFMVGQQPRGELNRYDSRSRQFLPYLGGISADWIDFSRDAERMTYSLYPAGTLWRSKIDGSQRLQLTFPPTRVLSPLWAPDGKRILFYDVGTSHPQFYIVSADGGKPTLVSGSNGFEMSVTWSPDGNSVMFSDFPFLLSKPEQAAVHILDLRSGHRSTIPGSEGLFGPVWSSNGKYAAAQTVHGSGIMLYDLANQHWKQIADGSDFFRWSKDSRFLFFVRHGRQAAIMKVQIANGKVEEVANVSGIHLTGMLPGLQYSLGPEDEPIILKDTGLQEIYSVNVRQH